MAQDPALESAAPVAERVQDHKDRQEKRGLVRVSVWVPAEKKTELRRVAAGMRAEADRRLPQDGVSVKRRASKEKPPPARHYEPVTADDVDQSRDKILATMAKECAVTVAELEAGIPADRLEGMIWDRARYDRYHRE